MDTLFDVRTPLRVPAIRAKELKTNRSTANRMDFTVVIAPADGWAGIDLKSVG
jgi:hypothetical protein